MGDVERCTTRRNTRRRRPVNNVRFQHEPVPHQGVHDVHPRICCHHQHSGTLDPPRSDDPKVNEPDYSVSQDRRCTSSQECSQDDRLPVQGFRDGDVCRIDTTRTMTTDIYYRVDPWMYLSDFLPCSVFVFVAWIPGSYARACHNSVDLSAV